MPGPAGRRQELAGLLLARAGARDPGGVAQGLQRGFAVEDRVHFGPRIQPFGLLIATRIDLPRVHQRFVGRLKIVEAERETATQRVFRYAVAVLGHAARHAGDGEVGLGRAQIDQFDPVSVRREGLNALLFLVNRQNYRLRCCRQQQQVLTNREVYRHHAL